MSQIIYAVIHSTCKLVLTYMYLWWEIVLSTLLLKPDSYFYLFHVQLQLVCITFCSLHKISHIKIGETNAYFRCLCSICIGLELVMSDNSLVKAGMCWNYSIVHWCVSLSNNCYPRECWLQCHRTNDWWNLKTSQSIVVLLISLWTR